MFKVMVTRPENQMLNFAESLEATGNRAILVPLIKIEYLELRNEKNLSQLIKNKNYRLFIAYYLKKIRLIDNY